MSASLAWLVELLFIGDPLVLALLCEDCLSASVVVSDTSDGGMAGDDPSSERSSVTSLDATKRPPAAELVSGAGLRFLVEVWVESLRWVLLGWVWGLLLGAGGRAGNDVCCAMKHDLTSSARESRRERLQLDAVPTSLSEQPTRHFMRTSRTRWSVQAMISVQHAAELCTILRYPMYLT